jgi:hypothetical protein
MFAEYQYKQIYLHINYMIIVVIPYREVNKLFTGAMRALHNKVKPKQFYQPFFVLFSFIMFASSVPGIANFNV